MAWLRRRRKRRPDQSAAGDVRSEISGSARDVVQARDVSGGVHFHTVPAQRRERVLAGLPPQPSGFVGRRAESAWLLESLDPDTGGPGAVPVCAVGGLAGVGKSALAVHAARRAVAEGWFHGAVFVNLRGYAAQGVPLQASGAVAVLLRALGIDEAMPPTADQQLAVYHAELAQLAAQGKRVLLVLDDVADSVQVDGLLPGDEAHRVVITSRQALGSLRARLLDLDVLSEAEAVELLAVALREARPDDPRAGQAAELAQVASACGGLPLALQIAAALLKSSPNRPVASLAGELSDQRARLELLRFPDSALRPGIRAALELSLRRLTAAQVRMLRLLTVDPGPSVESGAAAALGGLPVAQASELLYALEGAHLIVCDVSGRRWAMHDLVRMYGSELLDAAGEPDERAQARDRLLEYYRTTALAASNHFRALPALDVPAQFPGRVEALEWYDANRVNLVAAVALAAHHQSPDDAVSLALGLTDYFSVRRYLEDWGATQALVREVVRPVRGRDAEGGPDPAFLRYDLAEQRFDRAMHAQRRAAGTDRGADDHVDLEDAWDDSALADLDPVLAAPRGLEEAIDTLKRAAAVQRELGDRYRRGIVLGSVGLALRVARRLEEAIDVLQQAVAIHREAGDRQREGMALTNLGLALHELAWHQDRPFSEAADVFQRAAAVYREAGDRQREGVALANVGGALEDARRFSEMPDIYRRATGTSRRAMHDRRPSSEAIDVYQRAAAVYREIGDRQAEGRALTNLGRILSGAQRFAESRAALRQALELFIAINDEDAAARVRSDLGRLPPP